MDFLKENLSEVFHKDSWEVKTLGDIATTIFQGNSKISCECSNTGNFPAIITDDVMYSEIYITRGGITVDESLNQNKFFIKKGDLTVIVSGFSGDKLGKACVYWGEQDCIAGNHITVIKHSQNSRYLAHLFSSQYVRKQIKALCKGNRARVNKEDLLKIKLLLPDLETQNRIVEFLDKFVYLKSELAFEKEKRMKQFEHYRNSIFGRNEEEMRKKYFEKLEA